MSSNDPTKEPLKIVLAKLAESGKLPDSAIEPIYNGEIQLQLSKEFGKALDAYREGKIDEITFNSIQKAISEYATRLKEAIKETLQEPQVGITPELLDRIWKRMTLLSYLNKKLTETFKNNLPFSGKQFLIVLHFTKDLIPFLAVCKSLGLNPYSTHIFYKPYRYPHKDLVIDYLENEENYRVHPLENFEDTLKTMVGESASEPLVVIEDGGYIIPSLHKNFASLLENCIGGVEQTTRGIENDKKIKKISIPVMSVAESDLKVSIEPPHVADAVINNITSLISFERLRGRRVAIMGFGHIGKEIATLLQNRVNLTIYDPRSQKRTEANQQGFDVVDDSKAAVQNKFLVIGCSGETSIGRAEILSLRHPTYLVSATSDQKEIGMLELEALTHSKSQPLTHDDGRIIGTSYSVGERETDVRLLADGYPVNFWCSDSMPDNVSSLILSMILTSTIELIQEQGCLPSGIHCDKVNDCAIKYELSDIYERLCS